MRSALARHLRETRETRVSASRERQSNMAQRISFGRLFPRSRLVILAVCNGSIVVRERSREQWRGTGSDRDIGVSPYERIYIYCRSSRPFTKSDEAKKAGACGDYGYFVLQVPWRLVTEKPRPFSGHEFPWIRGGCSGPEMTNALQARQTRQRPLE